MGSVTADVPATNLPSSESSDLILSPATVSEQVQCWKINEPSWSGILSTQQYLDRERHLSEQSLTKNGQITYWILTTAGGKPDERPIYSACETLQKIGLVVNNPNSSTTNHKQQQVEEVICHGIGSVFSRSEYRGRGYAGRMIKELANILDRGWQQPFGTEPSFSILYSDIGQKFYNSFGWKPYPSTHVSLDPVSEQIYAEMMQRLDLPESSDLKSEDLELDICPKDVKQVNERLLGLAAEQGPGDRAKTFIAIRPDYEHMAWHHAREEFHAAALNQQIPIIKGATVPSASSSSTSSSLNPTLMWTRSYGSTPDHFVLNALRLILPSTITSSPNNSLVKSIASLLLRAQFEASKCGMKAFEIWSPDQNTILAVKMLKGVEAEKDVDIVIQRERESICSLRWNGGDAGREVVWEANEKYAWC